MKKLLGIVVLSFLLSSNTYSEIVKIDCTVNFRDGSSSDAYFELNSENGDWWSEFIGDKIFWTSVTKKENGNWTPIYHTVNRRTGKYIVDFGVEVNNKPKRSDNKVKIEATRTGTCSAATSKKLF